MSSANGECVRRSYPVKLRKSEVLRRGLHFAELISERQSDLFAILRRYETNEVAIDETSRTLDLLRSLSENAGYFERQIGPIAVFLPRNQPLYAFTCFAVVPALMAGEVHVHVPSAMRHFFAELALKLNLTLHFPTIHLSESSRNDFLSVRTPLTDAVIFTGNGQNADSVRKRFPPSTLFIANGAGHNPIVVTDSADIGAAVASVLRVQLYNQGQDCAAPNAVLVQRGVYAAFVGGLRESLQKVKIGPYSDDGVRVGPITDRDTVNDVHAVFQHHAKWLDDATPGIIRYGQQIVEPTIIAKPLNAGGNFKEHFAPIFFVQDYETDTELGRYFEDERYWRNAMYVTLFGESPYVEGLIEQKSPGGGILHDETTIIRNTDLHAPGIERGTQPYGGYGRWASSVSLNGIVTAKPTCPQRDIFEHLVKPALQAEV